MPRIMRRMNIISRCQALYRAERIAGELQPCHHAFVLSISREPGRSQEQIARELCLNKSTVARAIAQLEERGFVKRAEIAEDKRRTAVYPTEKMLAALPLVRAVALEWNEQIAGEVGEAEMAVFESVLEKLEKSARALVGYGGDDE